MEPDVKEQFDRIGALVEQSVRSLEGLIIDFKESLEREMGELKQGVDQLNTRFDTQAARLGRHEGLWQAGTRWSSRMDAWAAKVDSALEAKDHQIAELLERISRIEKRAS